MKLAERWGEILGELPRGWEAAWVALTLEDEAQLDRVALILGPAAPGRSHSSFRINVGRSGQGVAPSPELVRRVLERLDRDGIQGRLELVETAGDAAAAGAEHPAPGSLASQWEALVDELPADWSHLYAQLDLDSSDFVERGALLLAPANPLLAGGPRSLRFRCARVVGYGVAAVMARRCLERLDRERITGRLEILRVISEDRPVGTQGPVWRIDGQAV